MHRSPRNSVCRRITAITTPLTFREQPETPPQPFAITRYSTGETLPTSGPSRRLGGTDVSVFVDIEVKDNQFRTPPKRRFVN